MIIYIATNTVNGKSYIGKSKFNLNVRKKQHIYNSNEKQIKMYFHRAINKHGIDNFVWNILWKGNCSKKWLNELEKYYIYFYDTFNTGYNMSFGGDGGAFWTKERVSKERRLEVGRKIAKNRDNTYLKNGHFKTMPIEERRRNVAKRDNEYLQGKNNPFCKMSTEKRMEVILKGNKKRKLYRASKETKMKMSKTRRTMYKGRNNPMAKVFKLISPSGKIYIIKDGLENFCKDMDLSFGMIRKSIKTGNIIKQTIKSRTTQKTINSIGWRASECL